MQTLPPGESPRYILEPADQNAALLKNQESTLITAGPYTSTLISSDAVFSYLSPNRLLLVEGKELVMGDDLIVADSPVSINWQLDSGSIVITTASQSTIRIHISTTGTSEIPNTKLAIQVKNDFLVLPLRPGTHTISGVFPFNSQQIVDALGSINTRDANEPLSAADTIESRDWPAKRVAGFNAPITHIVEGESDNEPLLWVATGEPKPALNLLTEDGEINAHYSTFRGIECTGTDGHQE